MCPSVSLTYNVPTAKSFTRPLASFALAPSTQQHPLTSNVMVVNKEGDLELYAVHDTPKQAVWSARGDLAIAAQLSCRIIEGSRDPGPEEYDEWAHQGSGSLYTYGVSQSRSREDSLMRGRQKPSSGPVVPLPPRSQPLFGRGDEEGFPALDSAILAATRSERGGADESSTKKGRGEGIEHLVGLGVGMTSRNHSSSRAKRTVGSKGINLVIENDISMTMKRRASRGYGLSEVRSVTREISVRGD